MTAYLAFTVHGLPSPQGSKRGIPVKRAGGRVGVALVESAGDRVKTWRQDVRAAAERAHLLPKPFSANSLAQILGRDHQKA